MRIADSAGTTDAGRKRRRNEDAFVREPPLFAVADGMGGAQAGEVASRLAAAAFREFHEADELDPAERVAAIIQEANRRIYERARSDAQASGMGTTITAALVSGGSVAIGHVGDSRAYRLRGGKLEQLTEDHSLVADLVRSGRLTPQEADAHPQRSVITRALGTDLEVDVDTFTVEDTAVGPPNGRGETDLEDTLSGLEAPAALAASPTAVLEREEGEERQAWGRPLDEEEPQRKPAKPKRRRWGRRLFWAVLGLAFVLAVIAAAFWALSRANFIGADENGNVVVYQGVPWELGGGIDLFRARYVSRLQAVQLAEPERKMLFNHDLISYDEARDRLAPYETEGVP